MPEVMTNSRDLALAAAKQRAISERKKLWHLEFYIILKDRFIYDSKKLNLEQIFGHKGLECAKIIRVSTIPYAPTLGLYGAILNVLSLIPPQHLIS